MKNFPRTLLLALTLLPLVSHCASYSEVERLQNQLRTMNRRMEDMKSKQVDAQASSSEQVSQLLQQVQSLQSQLDDASQVNSRLKEQNKSLGQHDEALSKLEESLRAKDEKIAALEDRLKAQQENIRLVQAKKVSDTEKALREAQAKADAAQAKVKTLSVATPTGGEVQKITSGQVKVVRKTPAAVSTVQANTINKREVSVLSTPAKAEPEAGKTSAPVTATGNKLAEGKQLYAQKQYAKAQAAFEDYLATKPSESQAAEADYMIGECNFQNKQYNLAIISYQKVASKPTLAKAAAATLKQGMAFEQMADVEMARIIYKKLIDQHPGTSEAKTAQERLGKL
ncbi:MAG TPA: hypothetical protein DEB25_02490 [Desulfobulbaceae bacterium]|nr:hypothetical protein [Desulfobulbaceae bacterium]